MIRSTSRVCENSHSNNSKLFFTGSGVSWKGSSFQNGILIFMFANHFQFQKIGRDMLVLIMVSLLLSLLSSLLLTRMERCTSIVRSMGLNFKQRNKRKKF